MLRCSRNAFRLVATRTWCWPSAVAGRLPSVVVGRVASFSAGTVKNRESLGLRITSLSSHKISRTGALTATDQAVIDSCDQINRRLTTAIKNAAVARDWPAAIAAFQEAKPPDAVLYSVLLYAADRCDMRQAAYELYDDMVRENVPLTATHFSPLIRLAGRARDIARVCSFKEDLETRGILPDAFICSSLVDAYKRAGDVDGALRTWRDMKGAGVGMTEPLLSSLMSAVASTGNVAGTEALLQEAAGRFTPNRIHMNCMLHACRHAVDADSALRIVAELRSKNMRPDVITFTLLLGVLRLAGRPEQDIDSALLQMKEAGVAPDKYFVEEHLSCVIGMDLGKAHEVAVHEFPPDALPRALEAVRQAREAGVELTRMTLAIEHKLSQPLAPVWFKVLCDGPTTATTPGEYFWDRTSGTTQWERPVGCPIAGTVQSGAAAQGA